MTDIELMRRNIGVCGGCERYRTVENTNGSRFYCCANAPGTPVWESCNSFQLRLIGYNCPMEDTHRTAKRLREL